MGVGADCGAGAKGPFRARTEHALNAVRVQQSKVASAQFAFRTALEDPEFVFRSLAFVNFVSTWLVRFVDPAGMHPSPTVS